MMQRLYAWLLPNFTLDRLAWQDRLSAADYWAHAQEHGQHFMATIARVDQPGIDAWMRAHNFRWRGIP